MEDAIPRRRFLTGVGASAASVAATVSASGLTPPAAAQTTGPSESARPAIAAANIILKNGKVITVDAAFTIATSVAIAGTASLQLVRMKRSRPTLDRQHASSISTNAPSYLASLTAMLTWTGKVCATSFPHSDACVRSATSRIGLPNSRAARRRASGSSACRSEIRLTISMCPISSPRSAGRCARNSMRQRRAIRSTSLDLGFWRGERAIGVHRQYRSAQAGRDRARYGFAVADAHNRKRR